MEKTEHVSENEYVNAAKYLMYLLKSALHQSKIRKEPSKCTWEQVWELAQKNNVEATVSEVVAQYEGNIPSELRKNGEKPEKKFYIVRSVLKWRGKIFYRDWQKKGLPGCR